MKDPNSLKSGDRLWVLQRNVVPAGQTRQLLAGRGDTSITVNAQTNASPYEMAKVMAFQLKTSGR